MTRRDDARDLLARLERHYIKPGDDLPGGVFLPEVAIDDDGITRRADALYVGFTSASGRRLVGHEVKVHRSDWRAELDQPQKSEAWVRECHAWYIVAPSTDVVPVNELPEGWGLMLPGRSKTRMEIRVKAAVHADRTPSWKATHAIIQREDTLRAQAIRERIASSRARIAVEVEERVRRSISYEQGDAARERVQGERDAAMQALEAFGTALGVELRLGALHEWRDQISAMLAAEDLRSVVREGRDLRAERRALIDVAEGMKHDLTQVARVASRLELGGSS